MGVDFIKLVSLSVPAFLGAIDSARANGPPAVGHLPWRLDIRVASDAGARSSRAPVGLSHGVLHAGGGAQSSHRRVGGEQEWAATGLGRRELRIRADRVARCR